MQPSVVTVGPLAAANAALLAASQTPTSGVALTLTGSQPDVARRILLTFGNEGSNRTLLLTGTNHTGNAISETLQIASGASGTVQSQQDFLTLASALPLGGGWTAAATLGTSGVASSPWKMMNFNIAPMEIDIAVIVSGTVNYTVEYTHDDPNNTLGVGPAIALAWPHPMLNNKIVNFDNYIKNVAALRLTLNSFTNPGFATMTLRQSGISNF
jgi:hypothetical protein